MSSDADARLSVQPYVAAGIGPLHEEGPRSVTNDDVGNQLLEAWIILGELTIDVSARTEHRRLEI
jgi:hypothetical protein